MRALITGVGGQDGSYLAAALIASGAEVHALGTTTRPPRHCPAEVVLHPGDVGDVLGTRAVVAEVAPDEIYNLAAISSVARSWSEPDLTARVNGLGAAGLLESAWQCQERTGRPVRFMQASSAEIFGESDSSPQDESTPVRPVNPYGAAKAYAHHAVDVYRHRGLHATSLILYNHESPRRPATFVTRKISSTVAAIATGAADRLRLGNLDACRDWGWAPDFVAAMMLAVRAEVAEDFVIATGERHSVRDFVAAAFACVGIEEWEALVSIDTALVRPADPTDLRGDAGRAADRLGWRPTKTFAEIVAAMVTADLAGPAGPDGPDGSDGSDGLATGGAQ